MIETLVKGLRRSIQNPAIPLTSNNILEYFSGGPSSSGVRVNAATSLTYAPVWQAVTQISGDVAKLPIELFVRSGRNREIDFGNPRHRRVHKMPNERQSAFKFWRRAMVHALIWNRSYIRIMPNGELLLLLPDRTTWSEDRDIYVTEVDQRIVGLYPSEVIEIEGIQIGNRNECELVRKFRDSIGLALAAQGHNAKFFAQGGQPGGLLEIPPTFTRKAADNLEEGWRRKYDAPDSWFKTVILREGAKFHAITHSAEQSQLTESREHQVYEVARWYNLSPSRLGLPDATSYGSKSEDNRNYLEMTLSPWLCAITSELDHKYLPDDEQETHFFAHNTRSLAALDQKAAAERASIEFQMGAISPNDYLAETGRNPRDGGDFYVTPLNMSKSGPDAEEMPEEEPEIPPEPPENGGETEILAAQALGEGLNREMKRVISRVKREADRKKGGRFVTWWDNSKHQLLDDTFENCRILLNLFVARGGQVPDISAFFDRIDQTLQQVDESGMKTAIERVCDGFVGHDYTEDVRYGETTASIS